MLRSFPVLAPVLGDSIMPQFTALKFLSIGVCLILLIGILNRRRRGIHMPLMLAAFCVDLGMVLYIEIKRHVIEELPSRMTPFLAVHVTFSVAVLVLYVVMLVSGINNARNRRSRVHPKAAIFFVVARLGNLCTSMFIT